MIHYGLMDGFYFLHGKKISEAGLDGMLFIKVKPMVINENGFVYQISMDFIIANCMGDKLYD